MVSRTVGKRIFLSRRDLLMGVVLLLMAPLLITGCGRTTPASASADKAALYRQYSTAVNDARTVTPQKVFRDLTPISSANNNLIWENGVVGSRVLVATVIGSFGVNFVCPSPSGCPGWTCKAGGQCSIQHDYWVTVVPELKNFFRSTPYSLRRLIQLLGVPPSYEEGDGTWRYVVEMWVSPNDLYRPCPDSEISDSVCDTEFPKDRFRVIDTRKKVRVREGLADPKIIRYATYPDWFDNRTRFVYTPGTAASPERWNSAYPWTRLGYTYDWGSDNHVGLSEFVLHGDRNDGTAASFGIKSATKIEEYLAR